MFCFDRVILLIILGPESGPEPERPQCKIIQREPVRGPTADAAPHVPPAVPAAPPPPASIAFATAIAKGKSIFLLKKK